jgi:hypothetical protein
MVTTRKRELEERYEWFDILYPQRAKDRLKLEEMLLRGALSLAPYSILEYLRTPLPKQSTPKCKSVVVENRYIDIDHSRALSAFYSKSFKPVQKECTRLHFFSRRISSDDFIDLEGQDDTYLGFCVLRPFPYRRIGRTVLRIVSSQPALEFPTCHGDFSINLGGSRINMPGSCFMEQDTLVSACASVAMWMSTNTITKRFGLRHYTTTEITTKANEYTCQTRPMPSEGLIPEQMVHCLRTMGYDPILVPVSDRDLAKSTMYTAVESQIPPILLCQFADGGHHSIVAIGHGYNFPINNPKLQEVEWEKIKPLRYARSDEWVPYLLINDDQRGIFRKMTFLDPNKRSLLDRIRQAYPKLKISNRDLDEWYCPIAIDMNMPTVGIHQNEEIANIWGIILPYPEQVPLTSEQAESKAAYILRYYIWQAQIPIPKGLVFRTYLISSNEYKRRIWDSKMDIFVKTMYRGKPMPRWIWVTEISTRRSYNSPKPQKWQIRGEIIDDATSSPLLDDFVAFHYVSSKVAILATMKPEDKNLEEAMRTVWTSTGDKPYPGWIR